MKIFIDDELILEINDIDEKCLRNDLTSIREWVKDAISGKVNNCKKRMVKEWQGKLFKDSMVENIPATEKGFLESIVLREDYKNKVDRASADIQ